MTQLVVYIDGSIAGLQGAARAGTLYAILDACDEPRVPVKIRDLGAAATTLYPDEFQQEMWGIAPYLATVDLATLEWITGSEWSAPWGIFVVASVSLAEMQSHLRKFVVVHAPDGHESFFRFYDPRVLTGLLTNYDAAQLAELFGPVTAFGWLTENGTEVKLARRAFFGDAGVAPRITMRRPTGA